MALSQTRNPALCDEGDGEFWIALAQLQATVARRKTELAYVREEIDNARLKRMHAEERCHEIGLLVLSVTHKKDVWEYPRLPSWYETTLPNLPVIFQDKLSCLTSSILVRHELVLENAAARHKHATSNTAAQTCCHWNVQVGYLCGR